MGTTEEKLQKLMQTKDDIKTAINGSGNTVGDKFSDYPVAITEGKAYIAQKITEKGVAASGNDTFQQLGDKVGEIQSGGKQFATVKKGKNVEGYSVITNGFVVKSDIFDNTVEVEINSLIFPTPSNSMYSLYLDGGLVSEENPIINNAKTYIVVQGDGSFYFAP